MVTKDKILGFFRYGHKLNHEQKFINSGQFMVHEVIPKRLNYHEFLMHL